jgi:serine protein kinase
MDFEQAAPAAAPNNRIAALASKFDRDAYKRLHSQHSFQEYLEMVYADPRLVRTAYQRMYDMIVEAGVEEITRYRKKLLKYKFFNQPELGHQIYGLEETLYELVQVFRGAAGGYGTEKRLLLLRGPVGSSKSSICTLLKAGLERYTRTDGGALFTYSWKGLEKVKGLFNQGEADCPMHDDPLRLLPDEMRPSVERELNELQDAKYKAAVRQAKSKNLDQKTVPVPHKITLRGHLNPRCQMFWDRLMAHYNYDWQKVMEEHIVIHRLSFSEDKRVGIATFQPKDEKNQDATELTGDINYMALATYGVDSDPRAFSFDGEFQVGNRGVCEFIEILKLAKEFLYDILGATQERKVKPKKFSQMDIDEVLIGHSVHGTTPIPFEYDGVLDVLAIEDMESLDPAKIRVFSVNPDTREMELSTVKSVFSHAFEGEWVNNHQDGDTVTTTPNHGLYNEDYEPFYPIENQTCSILRLTIPDHLIAGKPATKRWTKWYGQVPAAEEALALA